MPTWLLFSFGSAIFAALVAIFGKIGIQDMSSTLATTVRSFIMSGVLLVAGFMFGTFRGVKWGSFSGREWFFLFLAGLAGALSWLCYFLALKLGDPVKVSAIDRMSLVFVVILAVLFLGESFTWKTALGAAVMVGGAILITLK
ncbi:MAG: EamA family transporter [Candidatus Magasanikbacteria bacterium]|nr:EamA family transporter [Candidatus Magasanikbacteria bacterium]